MTDKDILEEVKDNIKLSDRLGYWPFDKNSRDFTGAMKRLVQEVEKLRFKLRSRNNMRQGTIDRQIDEIDSLKAKLEASEKKVEGLDAVISYYMKTLS